MGKLLLTSAGFANREITKQFLKMVNKPVSEIKIIFVPTASRSEEELMYVNESRNQLLDIGILKENIKIMELKESVQFDEISDFDVIYVCGGNTFYLLERVRKTGFDKVIKQFLEAGKLYFGVSAGSIIAGPNISISYDENDVGMTNFTGMSMIDEVICPHYDKKDKEIVEGLISKSKFKVVPLTDNQALVVEDSEARVLG